MSPTSLGLALPAAAALLVAGCSFGDGGAFGRLEPSLEAAFDAHADREAGGGWQRLDTDYQVRLDRLWLTVDAVELQDTGSAEGGSFDPSSPPDGYSLCHSGHCHRDDGALISYEDIAADLAGGGTGATTVVSLPVGAIELLPPAARALACEPGCDLDRGYLGRARATITRIGLEGAGRDGRDPPRIDGEVPLALELDLGELPVTPTTPLDLPLEKGEPERIVLGLRLAASAGLLDGIDFGELAIVDGALDLGAAPEAVAENLSNVAAISAVSERGDD